MVYEELKKSITELKGALVESNNSYLVLNKDKIIEVIAECKKEMNKMICIKEEIREVTNKINDLKQKFNKYQNKMLIPRYHARNGLALALDRACRKRKVLEDIIKDEMANEKLVFKNDLEEIIEEFREKFSKM